MKINKNIAISESGLVFNPINGESFSVNPVGLEILNLLREEKSFDEICSLILARYNTDSATFDKDFHDFLNLMTLYGLIEEENEKKA